MRLSVSSRFCSWNASIARFRSSTSAASSRHSPSAPTEPIHLQCEPSSSLTHGQQPQCPLAMQVEWPADNAWWSWPGSSAVWTGESSEGGGDEHTAQAERHDAGGANAKREREKNESGRAADPLLGKVWCRIISPQTPPLQPHTAQALISQSWRGGGGGEGGRERRP